MVTLRSRAASIVWWRSPPTDPRHARPVLLAIVAVAAVLFCWRLDQALYHPYYSAAIRSMTLSWKAFLFGSFDPASTVTIDKVPGFLWPQAISARIFGFHAWSLVLPQAIAGIACVLVLYRLVSRWMGANAGLLAAAGFTLTPVTAGLFRSTAEDAFFTLTLLLAASAAQRAIATGGRRTLLAAGAWVGVAFQMKMVEAWAVLPVFAAVFLLAAPGRWQRRLVSVALAGAVAVSVSASWVLAVSVIPPQDRPYIDGSTDNSAVSMVVGYNFLNRFTALGLPPTADGLPVPTGTPSTAPTDTGFGKLVGPTFGSQVGWLYPLAALSAVVGIAGRRRRPRTDQERAGYVFWAAWLTVFAAAFAVGTTADHVTYLCVLAAPVAALSGAGVVTMARAFRHGRLSASALPVAVVGTVAWSFALDAYVPDFRPWTVPLTVVLSALALTALLLAKLRAASFQRAPTVGLAAGVAAMLVTPAMWALTVLDSGYPVSLVGRVGPVITPDAAAVAPCCTAALNEEEEAILSYVAAEPSRFTLVASDWDAAAHYIRSHGTTVLALGGFSTVVPAPSLEQFTRYAARGEVRYVALRAYGDLIHAEFGGGESTSRPPRSLIAEWVRDHCGLVDAAAYGRPPRVATAATEASTYLFDCATGAR